MTLVSLFGRPGAGKSTLGRGLFEQHGFLYLPLGDMLKNPRVLAEIGISPEEMRAAIESGRTVTSERLYPWLDERIRDAPTVVVDGYPRATNSLTPYAALVRSLPPAREVFALHLHCPTLVTHPRLAERGRSDDDSRIVRRDVEFETVQLPLLDRLPARTKLISIDATRDGGLVLADAEAALGLARVGGGHA